ncbi:YycH family regulatory protein [Paenibacillus sp. FJAT-27812]|uniref:YycH family regulatory protein n=1 Tax=Paenibacillus sp. FJAT-27812 TaxID=1684143 RepID=UPI0006A77BA5|nr:two-component system activity regulator YycH [Paenibacillus sp. FJAT-27812]
MKEKIKTTTLIVLVALSLLQSYLLAYSMPGLGATVRSDQDYVNAEPMGPPTSVESVIFPEELVIHLGGNKHTVIYPGTQFYDMILNQRIQGREFKGFQRNPSDVLNWEEIRKNDIGIELRFDNGIPVELLQKLLKLEGDLLFLNETIDRIWIFKTTGSEEVRTFFFSADDQMVYESVRADLTVRDVQDYVGFGQFQPKYTMTEDGLYLPAVPIQSKEMVFPYETYSPDLMQRVFFDPSTTRAIEDRSGSQIYTDGKRGLQVEQNGKWISYTDPSAPQITENLLSDNVYASVDFVNQHGGWDGVHRFVNAMPGEEGKYIRFKQYVEQYPVIEMPPFRYGYMKLTLQQGVVTEYARSLITLAPQSESRNVRWLPGGDELQNKLGNYRKRDEVTALFPALQAAPVDDKRLRFIPVWAVRLKDGTEEALVEAYPSGYEPPKSVDATEQGADGGTKEDSATTAAGGAGAASLAAGGATQLLTGKDAGLR